MNAHARATLSSSTRAEVRLAALHALGEIQLLTPAKEDWMPGPLDEPRKSDEGMPPWCLPGPPQPTAF